MQISNTFKSLVYRLLPRSLSHILRKRRLVAAIPKIPLVEEPDLAFLEKILEPGSVCFDVGANAGLYSYWLSQWVGDTGVVYAFEPIPSTCDILSIVKRTYSLDNCEVNQVALSDSSGVATMHVPKWDANDLPNYYQASLDKPSAEEELEEIAVSLTTLDEFVAQTKIKRLDLIKCDVEGHELSWLRGSLQTLEAFHPILLIEISDDLDVEGSNAWELAAMLKASGYTIHILKDGEIVPRQAGVYEVNYFFLKPQHLALLPE